MYLEKIIPNKDGLKEGEIKLGEKIGLYFSDLSKMNYGISRRMITKVGKGEFEKHVGMQLRDWVN